MLSFMIIIIYSDIVLRSNHLIGSKLSILISNILKVSRLSKCCTILSFKEVVLLRQNQRILGKFLCIFTVKYNWHELSIRYNLMYIRAHFIPFLILGRFWWWNRRVSSHVLFWMRFGDIWYHVQPKEKPEC